MASLIITADVVNIVNRKTNVGVSIKRQVGSNNKPWHQIGNCYINVEERYTDKIIRGHLRTSMIPLI